MINAIVTKLNSQLPDATIVLNNYITECNTGIIEVDYTVFNVNSTEFLPANTPITFYIQNTVLGTYYTQNDIPIGGSENGSVILNIPIGVSSNFTLTAVVDDNGTGTGIVTELVETNNTFEAAIDLKVSPTFNFLEDLLSCNLGLTRGVFDFSSYEELVKSDPSHSVTFHENYDDAVLNSNEIFNTTNFEALTTPKEIFVRIENEFCYSITSFNLLTRNCPPEVFNAVSANNDGLNDVFFIEGLRDIFVNFKLEIYNRWGRHIWTGDNSLPDWDGKVAKSVGPDDAPAGTYYYVLYLNDPDYNEPLTGYLYLTR
jgi:gliding motility-associated-like protein